MSNKTLSTTLLYSIVVVTLTLFFLFPTKAFAQVVINEFLVEPNPEWVEFYNSTSGAEYLKNYWIDDDTDFASDTGSSTKKQLTNLDTSSAIYPFIELSSFLNNTGGDYVVVFDEVGNIVDQYQYTDNPGSGVSIGRNPDNTGSFSVLSSATKGGPNSAPPSPTPIPSPTPTNTPTSTSTPTPTSTPKPTATTKPTATPKITATPTTHAQELTLATEASSTGNGPGEEDSPSPTSVSDVQGIKKFPFLAAVFISVGLGAIGLAVFSFLRNRKKAYNGSTDGEGGDTDQGRID